MEKRVEDYLNIATVIFVVIDTEQKVDLINKKGCEVLGYQENEIIGKNWFDNFIPERLRNEVRLVFLRLISGEITVADYFENPVLTKTGEEKLIRWHNTVLRNQDNKITGTLSSGEDITERKRIEESARASERRYRDLVETMHEFVSEIQLDGVFQFVNQPFCKAAGYQIQELVGTNFFSYLHPDDSEKTLSHCRLLQESKKPIYNCEYRFRKKDGTYLDLLTNGDPVYDSSGNLKSVLQISFDITERKKIEKALKSAEEQKEIVLNSLTDLVVYHDLQSRVMWTNKAAGDSVGVKPEDLIGRYCYEIWHSRKKACPGCSVIKARQTGKPQEHQITSPDGRIWFIRGFPVKDENDNVTGVVEVAQDVTRRKKAEEELERLNKELAKTNRKLQSLALKDYQTSLYNHLYLADIIEAEFYRARRLGTSLSAIMLDIDYFKSINDVYGYQFGDMILKQFARQLKKMVRRYDIIVRFGGEEFVGICPGINRQQTVTLARRILNALNLYNFGDKKHTVKIKLSIAVASYPEDRVIKGMDLIELTENILGEVKEYGGNKVYSSQDIKKKRHSLSEKGKESAEVTLLKKKIDKLTKQSNQSLIEAVFAFAKTIEFKDHYTGEHSERTIYYATEIARLLDLSQNEVENIRQAAILHDLGKIGISEKILGKKAKLTPEEFDEIKKHPQIGVDIIRPIQFLHGIIPLILYHHERWDGKGYPAGLKGEDIPIGARIISVADVYQALTSNRPYRKAYPGEEAVKIIKSGSGKQFDPKVVEVFLKILSQEKNKK